MKMLNHLQVQPAITLFDLGIGRNRECYLVLSDFNSCLSGIRHSSDLLVHHGRHFGRTVYAMCNVRSLITNALLRLQESDGEILEESLTTEYVFFWSIYPSHGVFFLLCRARVEHEIFQKLQAMVPNLTDRVVESEAALSVVAESVWAYILLVAWHFLICCRSRRAFLVHVQMIQKAWKVLSSTGSTHATTFYNQSSLAMLRRTADSITLLLAPYSARLVMTGTYLSEFNLRFKILVHYNVAGCARSSRMAK